METRVRFNENEQKHYYNEQASAPQAQENINYFRLNRLETTNQLNGYCKIDGKTVKFLADTGATKTIIDVKMLADLVDQSIVPTKYKVILADGSPVDVLGIKQCQIHLGNYVVNMESSSRKIYTKTVFWDSTS